VPIARSVTSSVHDHGQVKPVSKTSSETGLGKQIVRILRAELRCNDIEAVVPKWRPAQRGHLEGFIQYLQLASALNYVIDNFKDETVKAVREEQKKATFSFLSGPVGRQTNVSWHGINI
jgi:hypothetical protein